MQKKNPNRSPRAGRRPNRPAEGARLSRGVALIAVLWVVLLLAVIGGSLTMLTRTELDLSRNLVLSARAEALAEGGIHLAIDEMLAARSLPDSRPGSRPGPPGGLRAWRMELAEGILDISIADVVGRIDLNAAPPALIAGLFEAAGAGEKRARMLAARIADWRDADDKPRPDGGEQSDYEGDQYQGDHYEGARYEGANPARRGPPVRVGNAPFLSADEIMRIPGMTAALWARIADAVTVHSRRAGVNPLYAPKIVLLALPAMDAATADAIMEARREPAAKAGIAGLVGGEARRHLTGGASDIYAVRARAELPEGAVYVLDAVIEPAPANDPPWRVHEWRPGDPESGGDAPPAPEGG